MQKWSRYYPGTMPLLPCDYSQSRSLHPLAREPLNDQEKRLHERGSYEQIYASASPQAPAGLRKYEKMYRKVPWDVAAVNDIWFALHYFEGFVSQLIKLRADAMCYPFTVKVQGMPTPLQPFLKQLVQHVWLDCAYQIFLYRIAFGIVPYYTVEIPGTAHAYPVVPPIESGRVVGYIDENDTQHYEWEWYSNILQCAVGTPEYAALQKERKKRPVRFIRTGYEPMQNGKLRAPACAILERYREIVLASRDEMYASYWSTHPLSVYENKPPASAGQRDDSKLRATALDFGEDVLGIYSQYEAQLREQARYSSEKQVEMELERLGKLHTEFQNMLDGFRSVNPVLQSDVANEEDRLKFQHNRLLLPRDVTFAGQATPKPIVDIDKKREGAIAMAAEIIGIPIELTQTKSKQHKSNSEGIFESSSAVLRGHRAWLNVALTRLFTSIYGETIRSGWKKLGKLVPQPKRAFQSFGEELKYEIELAEEVDIQVTLYSNPTLTKNDVYDLVARGFMEPEEAVRQLTAITDLSPGVLKVTTPPSEEVAPVAKKRSNEGSVRK